VSVVLSVFTGIVIINAFNLVDGVDGLASSIAMLASFIFGSYFIITHEWEYAVLSFTMLGALIPFFYFNVLGKKNKIFMGDTGSLILGFLMTVLVFRFNEKNAFYTDLPHFIAGPAFSFSVLIIPMFDTLRVFTIRILRKKSPFVADRRHIHHLLLDFGFSHLQTTLILIVINLLFITIAYFLDFLGNSNLVYVMLTLAVILSFIAMYINRKMLTKTRKADLSENQN
jgi:UDP-N-acetylmuramyl pentapeptide phosphotransferase/UDP-N-acetylglucosamine-1-phosphate transferase